MNKFILPCLVAVATAAPQYLLPTLNLAPTLAPAPSRGITVQTYSSPAKPPPVEILRDDREGPDASGSYSFIYESADGISRQEQGAPQGQTGAVATQGGWSFTFPDGTPAQVTFVADASGYQPQSNLLPVGPPLPPHAIAQIEKARLEDAAAAAAAANTRFVGPSAPVISNQYSAPQTVFLLSQ